METALKHNKRPLVLLAGGKLEDRQKLLEAFNEFELIGPGLKPSNKDLPPEQKSQFKSIGEIFNRYLNPR